MDVRTRMTAGQPLHRDLDGSAGAGDPIGGEGVHQIHTACTGGGGHALILGVQIDEAACGHAGVVELPCSLHAGLLSGSDQALQLGMGDGVVVQDCHDDGNGNAVVTAQRSAAGAHPIAVDVGDDGIGQKIVLHVGVFLADHVHMPLEKQSGLVGRVGSGLLHDEHVQRLVLIAGKTSFTGKLHQIIGDRLLVPRSVGNLANILKKT